MKKSCTILTATLVTILLGSCCAPAPTGPYAVVAGYYSNGTNDVASSWKDDTASAGAPALTKLFETTNARALSVFLYGTDVYVAGYYTNGSGRTVACYWKNGSLVPLYNSDTYSAKATGIFYDGVEVYVSGWVNEGTQVAGYWHDATWVPLEATASEGSDIVVSGTDVYVSGYSIPTSNRLACYWLNGTPVPLEPARYSEGLAITLSGSDVYVAGYLADPLPQAGYWKNAIWVPLHDSSYAKAFDVAVSGSDVYVAGYYNNASSKNVACYWENSAENILYDDASMHGRASGIALDGSDVYVAGTYDDDGITKKACYWKNGVRTPLESATSECYALAIQD